MLLFQSRFPVLKVKAGVREGSLVKKYFLSEKWDYNLKCHGENGNCVLEARLQVLLGEVQGQCLCSSCPYLQQHRRDKHQYKPLKEKLYFHINGLFLHPRGPCSDYF